MTEHRNDDIALRVATDAAMAGAPQEDAIRIRELMDARSTATEPDPELEALASRYGFEAHLNAPVSKTDIIETDRQRCHMDWSVLAQADAPEFEWLIPHWLSWHPTLLSGRGSIGKSLLAQQLATALATGTPFIGAACPPMKVLCWMCEDEHDELWRRQERICASMGLPLGGMGNLTIDARYGLKNELFVTEFGRGAWTPIIGELQKQIEETQSDVVILDNIGHIYGGDENNRHQVTMFTNGIAGLANGTGRKICTLLLGHPAKSIGSEYSGSTAWENSVRMRWYMDDKLPDQKADDSDEQEPETNIRYLSKRKSNYTALDFVKFRFDDRHKVLVPDQVDAGEYQDTATIIQLRRQRAESVIINAIKKLAEKGEYGTNSPSRTYLPTVIIQYKLHEECSRKELSEAMRTLIMAGKIRRDAVGKNAAGYKREGLVIVE
jgi:RecA-family ATPase